MDAVKVKKSKKGNNGPYPGKLIKGKGYAFYMKPLPLSKVELTSEISTSIVKAMVEGRGVAGAAADCAGDIVHILPYCSDVKDTSTIPAYAIFKIVRVFIELNLFDEVLEDFLSLTEGVNAWMETFNKRAGTLTKTSSSS